MAGGGLQPTILVPIVIKERRVESEQHYGHSGITAWKENMQWSAWLRDY